MSRHCSVKISRDFIILNDFQRTRRRAATARGALWALSFSSPARRLRGSGAKFHGRDFLVKRETRETIVPFGVSASGFDSRFEAYVGPIINHNFSSDQSPVPVLYSRIERKPSTVKSRTIPADRDL